MIKRITYWLQKWDVVWSGPLSFIAFIAFAWFMQSLFGESFGSYDPAMYQAAIYAIGIMVLFNGSVLASFWFNWRVLYKYYLVSAKNDFEDLQAWQRLAILFLWHLSLFAAHIFVWDKLV